MTTATAAAPTAAPPAHTVRTRDADGELTAADCGHLVTDAEAVIGGHGMVLEVVCPDCADA